MATNKKSIEEVINKSISILKSKNDDFESYMNLLNATLLAYTKNYLQEEEHNLFTGELGSNFIQFELSKDPNQGVTHPEVMKIVVADTTHEKLTIYGINTYFKAIPNGFMFFNPYVSIRTLNKGQEMYNKPIYELRTSKVRKSIFDILESN